MRAWRRPSSERRGDGNDPAAPRPQGRGRPTAGRLSQRSPRVDGSGGRGAEGGSVLWRRLCLPLPASRQAEARPVGWNGHDPGDQVAGKRPVHLATNPGRIGALEPDPVLDAGRWPGLEQGGSAAGQKAGAGRVKALI